MLRIRQGRLPLAYWVSRLYFCSLLISNTKARKPVVTVGASEKWKTGPGSCGSIASTSTLHVNNRSPPQRRPSQPADPSQVSIPSRTASTNTPQPEGRKNGLMSGKNGGNRHLRAQLLGQFIEQPVQILVVLANLFNLVHRMQDCCVVLAAELASNFRQGSFRKVLGQIHRNLPRIHDGTRIVLRLKFHQAQAELLGHRLLNGFNRHLAGLRIDEILQYLLGVGKRDGGADQRRMGH